MLSFFLLALQESIALRGESKIPVLSTRERRKITPQNRARSVNLEHVNSRKQTKDVLDSNRNRIGSRQDNVGWASPARRSSRTRSFIRLEFELTTLRLFIPTSPQVVRGRTSIAAKTSSTRGLCDGGGEPDAESDVRFALRRGLLPVFLRENFRHYE